MTDILIVKPSSLGDIVHGLVVAQSIREQMPDARISWAVRDIFAPLIERSETVNGEIFLFHRGQGFGAFRRLLREIGERKYDVALDMQGLMRSGWMIWAATADRKIGRGDAREGAGLFCRESVPLPENSRHAVDILLQFMPLLGLEARPGGPLRFSAVPAIEGSDILLCPESRRPEKVWPHFRRLAERLVDTGKTVSWIGQRPADVPTGVTDLTRQTDLDTLIQNVGNASIVIANDSGPMHLAAAMGRRVVALFGPTDPARFGPYPLDAPNHHVLRAPGGDLTKLGADAVTAHVLSMLKQTP